MKRLILAVAAVCALGSVTAVFADGEWLRSGPVWFKGLVYAGTSKVAITNAAGNLSTTTLALSGNETVGGNLSVTGTLAVTGATTLKGLLNYTSVTAGVTASTWSAQGLVAASGLVSTFATQASTSGSAGDSLTLPAVAAGAVYMACNRAAANAIDVFPYVSDAINKETANVAIALAAGECMFCLGFDDVQWGCVIGSAT